MKPKLFPVLCLSDANRALELIGGYGRKVTLIETEMNSRIDQAKAEAEAAAAPLKEYIAGIEAGLQAYAEQNKQALFKERRSQELDFGSIGFRKSSGIKTKSKITWKMVLARLKELKFCTAIRTKEEVNKEELSTWPDERLDLVGVRRVEKDQFWYEVDQEKVADTAN